MAATDSKLKQRIVGALVLVALAVIFVPMLLKNDEPVRDVVVEAPEMPAIPVAPEFAIETVDVPEPVIDPAYAEWGEIIEPEDDASVILPVEVIAEPVIIKPAPVAQPAVVAPSKPAVAAAPAKPVVKPAAKAVAPGIDKNNLPVSWSVQLANLTNKANAEGLRDTYRKKQYNAYVRSADGTHRVLIGPLVRQSEAQAMCKNLKSREGQECFVVRYQP
ncbi:MAG TPA: SPOR domain-containing protein [Thiopseudomonas sp.]|nr:SPOR domain-containing protein [Thiopseudomonas sp.]